MASEFQLPSQGPRIKNVSPDELRRLFQSPETAAPQDKGLADFVSLTEALKGRELAEKQRQSKIAEIERNLQMEEEKRKLASQLQPIPSTGLDEEAQKLAVQDQLNQASGTVANIDPIAEFTRRTKQDALATKALSGRDIQQKNLLLPDGTRTTVQLFETRPSEKYGTAVTWTDLAGNEIDPNTLQGAVEAPAPSIVMDQFGNPTILERVGPRAAQGVSTPASQLATQEGENLGGGRFEGGLNELLSKAPKVYVNVEEQYKKAFPENNKFLETMVQGASSAAQVKEILQAEGENVSEVGLQSLGFYFARMAGSNSQLSDREREVFEQPLALLSTVKNKGYRALVGRLSPKMVKDLLNLATVLEKKSRAQTEKILNGVKKRSKAVAGKLWNKQLDSEFPTSDELIVSQSDFQSSPEKQPGGLDINALGNALGLPRKR